MAWLVFRPQGRGVALRPRGFAMATAFVLAFAALQVPWVVRNYRVFGDPIVTTTLGGFNLYRHNAMIAEGKYHTGYSHPEMERRVHRLAEASGRPLESLDEAEINSLLKNLNRVSTVLDARDEDIVALMADADTLFRALVQRKAQIHRLLESTTTLSKSLTGLIREVHVASRGTYGYRRVHAELTLGMGVTVCERTVSVLMTQAGLYGLPGPTRIKRLRGVVTADDLVNRKFHRLRPNELWVTDITQHRTPWIPAIVATVGL